MSAEVEGLRALARQLAAELDDWSRPGRDGWRRKVELELKFLADLAGEPSVTATHHYPPAVLPAPVYPPVVDVRERPSIGSGGVSSSLDGVLPCCHVYDGVPVEQLGGQEVRCEVKPLGHAGVHFGRAHVGTPQSYGVTWTDDEGHSPFPPMQARKPRPLQFRGI